MVQTFTHSFDSSLFKGTIVVNKGLFIDGQWVDPVDNVGTFDLINPVNDNLITTVPCASTKDVDLAVRAARQAFRTSWGLKVPGSERGKMLYKLAELFELHRSELSALDALNNGKHFRVVERFDMGFVIDITRYYAGWADKNQGHTIETNELKFAYTRREPIGVCGLILPWNLPLLQAMCKLAPALATGNTVIVKPSEFTPLSLLKLAEYIIEAGFPPGVFNVVLGTGPTVGQAIVDHPHVQKVSMTGSTAVGRKIVESAGRTNLKNVTLELGGKNPTIIFDDAEFEQALKWAAIGIFNMTGQMCMAGSRIFVQEGIYDRFIEGFVAAAESITFGDPFDPACQQGPVVSKQQMERILGYIASGKTDGATLVTGGARIGTTGCFIQPTIFTDAQPHMKIVREEIFGPVAVVIKFKDEQEVVDLANDTLYGLSASVFTRDIGRAFRVAHALEAGQTFINSNITPSAQVPFGGMKQSGIGYEMGQEGLDAYTTVRAIHVNLGMEL